ncbi:hypothetical protein [Bifidobacterium stellenboschense]|nr:hypothetical protein [Bifidobacterium stellenboschense]
MSDPNANGGSSPTDNGQVPFDQPQASDTPAYGQPYGQPQPYDQQPTQAMPAPWQAPGAGQSPASAGQSAGPDLSQQPTPQAPQYGAPAPEFQPAAPAYQGGPVPGAPAPAYPGAPAPDGAAPAYPAGPAPAYPGGPVPGAPGAPAFPGAPAPKKKGLSKGALIGIIAGAIAAVLVIVLVVVFVVVKPGSLKADDYLDGQTQTTKMYTKYSNVNSKMSKAMSTTYDNKSTFDKADASKIKQYIKDYEQANKEFTDLKVYKHDDKVKEAYDKYEKKAQKFVTFSTNMADTAVAMSAVTKACDATPTASYSDDDYYSEYNNYIKGCTSALGDLGDSKIKPIAEYATTMKDYLTKLGDIMKQMEALGSTDSIFSDNGKYQQFSDLTDQLYALESPYNASSDLNDGLTDLEKEANPSEELNDLTDLLQDGFNDKM